MKSPVSYAIDIENLSKRFKRRTIQRGGYSTIKSALVSGVRRFLSGTAAARPGAEISKLTETWAVRNVTLRIPKGASVGLIGRNGSGKSTLLKLMTGIYKPDAGHISMCGRVAALIELGAGFHPDFTARENLILGGVMHGLSRREVEQKIPEIIEFAELAHVIDDPVRTYSSGMFMRLGFSLAVHTNPDILLIDEVLAVGDATFVSKCKERIAKLRREGRTLLLVTHDLDAVERWCDEALWLEAGEVRDRGQPRRVIDHYREFIEKGEESELRSDAALAESDVSDMRAGGWTGEGSRPEAVVSDSDEESRRERWGSREVEVIKVALFGMGAEEKLVFHPDDCVRIQVRYAVHDARVLSPQDVVFGICITRSDGVVVFGTNTDIDRVALPPLGREGVVWFELPRIGFLDGRYRLDVAAHRSDGYPFDYHRCVTTFSVRWPHKHLGVTIPEYCWKVEASASLHGPMGQLRAELGT